MWYLTNLFQVWNQQGCRSEVSSLPGCGWLFFSFFRVPAQIVVVWGNLKFTLDSFSELMRLLIHEKLNTHQ